jgi:hypothetical protein
MQARQIALLAGLVLALPAAAAAPRSNPDWPCQQRLVPSLGAGSFWPGFSPENAGDWQAEPRVADLVARISPRHVSAEDGIAAIDSFVASLAADPDKTKLLTLLFAGVFAETNRERGELITRLEELGKRQHDLADIASQAEEELQKLPADADAAKRTDLEERFAYVTRAFETTQRTMRYACQAPVRLEARLGRYAEAIRSHL